MLKERNSWEKRSVAFEDTSKKACVDYDPPNIYDPASSRYSIRMLISPIAGSNRQLEGGHLSNADLYMISISMY